LGVAFEYGRYFCKFAQLICFLHAAIIAAVVDICCQVKGIRFNFTAEIFSGLCALCDSAVRFLVALYAVEHDKLGEAEAGKDEAEQGEDV
jgi:hypothetical protein